MALRGEASSRESGRLMSDTEDTVEPAKLPLDAWHRAQGARMVPFAGYEMPIQYEGIVAEHEWTRAHAGLFDVSHMGQLLVSGERAAEALEALLPGDISARHMFARSRDFLTCWRRKGSTTWSSRSSRWMVTSSPSRAQGHRAATPFAVSHFSATIRSSIASASRLRSRAVSPTTASSRIEG